ncbi:yippee-domain-containing protein [Dacryopinax primogenitus]|uniref:Protein yippee-like n=1 Tax=Dacryopinax primogenitus (strain DJM 731) TaxID=1858805 RepID=M5G977_DACPD|nr:yippee-domain-containing protein [Dacryopinax primogenitus]EJU04745.1 yippee-domain-containing protein [Dacryopinax primogenitus]
MTQEPTSEPLELDPPNSNGHGKSPATGSDEDGALLYLGDRPVYSCATCSTHLALQDELISKAFSGREGVAFLFHTAINVKQGKKEERMLLTGMHTVADITCMGCGTSVGWTYLKAYETSQKYKEVRLSCRRFCHC